MAILTSLLGLFPSFQAGQRLIDGGDLITLVNLNNSGKTIAAAFAGGGQTGALSSPAYLCNNYLNEVLVVTTTADSIAAPFAVPGVEFTVWNSGANSCTIMGQAANPNNNNAADQFIAHNSVALVAAGTGIAIPSGQSCVFSCARPGIWKQQLDS